MKNAASYTVLNQSFRFDTKISASEKLILAEIIALSHVNDFCYATNAHFAELFGVHKQTVSRWINNLVRQGYLRVVLIRDEKGMITQRQIYLTEPSIKATTKANGKASSEEAVKPQNGVSSSKESVDGGYKQSCGEPINDINDTPISDNAECNTTSSVNNLYIYDIDISSSQSYRLDMTSWMKLDPVDDTFLFGFLQTLNKARAGDLDQKFIDRTASELLLAMVASGLGMEYVLRYWASKGWRRFKAEWMACDFHKLAAQPASKDYSTKGRGGSAFIEAHTDKSWVNGVATGSDSDFTQRHSDRTWVA